MAAFVVFCVLSGVVYLVNDLLDRDADRRHPDQAAASDRLRRPVARHGGRCGRRCWDRRPWRRPPGWRPAFGVTAAAYLALFAVYSRWLKHVVILDVLSIAIGFVLRAAGRRRR